MKKKMTISIDETVYKIMAADKRRLKSRLGVLSASDMASVNDALRLHLGI